MPVKAYKPYGVEDDQTNPYSDAGVGSDSNADDPNTPWEGQEAPPRIQSTPQDTGPKPYTPPNTVATPPEKLGPTEDAPPPIRTFAQMENEGQARPPMPQIAAPQVADEIGMVGNDGTPQPYTTGPTNDTLELAPSSGGRDQYGAAPGERDELARRFQQTASRAATSDELDKLSRDLPDQSWDQIQQSLTGTYGAPQVADETRMVGTSPTPPSTPSTSLPSSVDSLLPLLTGKATGNDKSALQQATEAKTLEQLNGSSPYDSAEVKNEYDFLAGNIDDQFSQDVRGLDEGMAQRGLYGSTGKDFHGGRLSDLNVGKRTGKISLARDLANKYATTKGQSDANAINQGQQGTQQADNSQQDWLRALMGFGNDAFDNDLQTANFQQRQNESEQDYMLRLLEAGYGT